MYSDTEDASDNETPVADGGKTAASPKTRDVATEAAAAMRHAIPKGTTTRKAAQQQPPVGRIRERNSSSGLSASDGSNADTTSREAIVASIQGKQQQERTRSNKRRQQKAERMAERPTADGPGPGPSEPRHKVIVRGMSPHGPSEPRLAK